KADEARGFSLLASLLRKPLISDETVGRAKSALVENRMTAWQVVLSPVAGDVGLVRGTEVLRLYRTLVRPDRIFVGIGGDVRAEDVSKRYADRMDDWQSGRPDRPSLGAP